MTKHKKVFAKEKFDIGTVKNYEATIKLMENKYIAKKPYKCSIQDRVEIESQIKQLLKTGLIEESCSPYAAPVTLVYKKEEARKSRLCIDYRELNKIVVPESQPFPRIEDLTLRARNCKYFTKLDVNSAFWSIPLRIKDRYKTAFVTHHGHWQWCCLPFGLKSSPAIFQRILSSIIRKHQLETFAVNYIDDILVYSKDYRDHMKHIELTLKALQEQGIKLNLAKCVFTQSKITYLGHEIGNNCVRPLNDNVIAINNFPTPQTRKHIRQFLGKINFYLEYIPRSTILLEPLHNLLRKNVEYKWSKYCQESFKKIKEYLCSKPILAIFDPAIPIKIYTDACLQGVGAILKQNQSDGKIKPVFFFSRKLTESQKTKRAIYIECLAIKEAILYWQYYLIGQKFTVFTDHKPLENFNIKKCNDPELRQILNYLSQFDFEIKYNPGKKNLEADCLSRNPVLDGDSREDETSRIKIVNFLKMDEIVNNQKQLKLDNKCEIENNIIYKTLNNRKKIWLTEKFGIELIKHIHNKQGHIGTKQITLTITHKVYFKNMHKHIKTICRSCETCIKNKTRIGNFKAPLSQLGPASEPFEIMALDTIGGFAGNKSTKRYLHLLIDHFTRYAFILTSKTQIAKDFIKLVDQIKNENRIQTLLTDQYAGINSKEFKQHLKTRKINLVFTAVDCAFSNGLNERTNQTLVNRIRCKIFENKNRPWSTIAEECVEEYNNTIHSSTGFTPNYLLTGRDKTILPNELNYNYKEKLEDNRSIAYKNSKKIHEQNKTYYDKNKVNIEYKVGDLVYIQNSNKLNRNKLDPIRIGPYEIKAKISNLIYIIGRGQKKNESQIFHASKLIPCHSPLSPLTQRGGDVSLTPTQT
ncbi:uncharacterized protein [Venturia canescens]|uniref:uncharacterized protein isoform X1 n=1 Tax=Venturia canescens TaxID=32260 RepID=UPI001C9D0B48|nr:uncharacterized protein LOC122408304 isoform X1 [Venturia canescens]